jgi:hypothetical protein
MCIWLVYSHDYFQYNVTKHHPRVISFPGTDGLSYCMHEVLNFMQYHNNQCSFYFMKG